MTRHSFPKSATALYCLLSGSTALTGITQAQASDNTNPLIRALVDESTVKLGYRQLFWNESYTPGYWGSKRDEWVHGAIFDYSSGYINDMIGFDYSFGAADKLYIGDDVTNVSNLTNNRANPEDPDGLAGTTQAFIKAKFGDEDMGLKLAYGKRSRSGPYIDDATRVLPASTFGYDIDANLHNFHLFFTEISKYSPRDEDYWGRSLTNFRGERIDHLRILGAEYAFDNGLTLTAQQAESKDYIRERSLGAQYITPFSDGQLELGVYYANMEDVGDLYEAGGVGSFIPASAELDARYWEGVATYRWNGNFITVGHSQVSGDDYNRTFFSADVGKMKMGNKLKLAAQWFTFGLEDEDMWLVRGGTNFAKWGVPGLNWSLQYAHSGEAKGFDNFRRYEVMSLMQYNLESYIKGLNVIWVSVKHQAEGNPDGIHRTSYEPMPQHDANRLYLMYDIKF